MGESDLIFRGVPLVTPPDALSIPQVFLDDSLEHPSNSARSKLGNESIPCLIEETTGRRVYKEELRTRTRHLSQAIKATWNIGEGDRVLLFCPNHVDYVVCVWAIHSLGASVAPTSPSLTIDEFLFQVKIINPALLIAHSECLHVAVAASLTIGIPSSRIIVMDKQSHSHSSYSTIEGLIYRGQALPSIPKIILRPGEAKKRIAFLCFSSGTTGKPKAVAISHYNVICNVMQVATFNKINEQYAPEEERRFRPGDICTGVLPLYHIYGLVVNLHFILYAKMTLVVSQKFDFSQMLQNIARFKITHLMIVPPQAVLLCKHPLARTANLSSVRYCIVAGAPVTAELTKLLLERLPNIHLGQAYGMTETCAAVSMWPVSQKVGILGSAGQLVAGTLAKVVKPDGSLANVNEVGELYIKGGQVAMGYYLDEIAKSEVFDDGWIRTGDQVLFRADEQLYIVDRVKEVLKVKGFQVAPAELEGYLLDHPAIADCGVIGIPDEFAGEVPLAFVVLQPEVSKKAKISLNFEEGMRADIFKHISSLVSDYKRPVGGIEFVDSIPKNPSGKILRRILRKMAKELFPRSKL